MGPASPHVQVHVDHASSQPLPTMVWPQDKSMAGVPSGPRPGTGPSEASTLAPLALSYVFPSSETGKCLSRAKASPWAQLSCSKVGGVESCSLSCPAHSLFVPGNLRPSSGRDFGVGEGASFPGVLPLFPAILQERAQPRRLPGPDHQVILTHCLASYGPQRSSQMQWACSCPAAYPQQPL